MGIFDKAKDLAAEHSDKVERAIDKVGDVVDEKTEHKYVDQVDKAQAVAKEQLKKK